MVTTDLFFRAKIVWMILSKNTDEALMVLSNYYEVLEPKLKVGMPKRYSKNPACYVHKSRTIHVSHREILYRPNIILHEFYHHLRSVKNAQGGIEKYADSFAKKYFEAYKETKKMNHNWY
jgi:hypothetical protein